MPTIYLDEVRASEARDDEERERRLKESPAAFIIAQMKRAPLPPDADKPLTFSINGLRQLSPWARVLYVMRDQVTD
jgi:hypothetical protein